MDTKLQNLIEKAYQQQLCSPNIIHKSNIQEAVATTIKQLDAGNIRVASSENNQWITHEWVKKAILLSFRINKNTCMSGGFTKYFDKVPLKYQHYQPEQFNNTGTRIVPPTVVRQGAYIADNCVLMPCYVNIGAYIDKNSMIDTWATVGSCAQIGQNVHISGGAGIGGVLEPLQNNPTIIEDNCFIGARSEIVEGVIVGKGSVISMGVYLGQSTKIYNRQTQSVTYGVIPPGSVVVSGNLPAKDGSHSLYCAVIVKQVSAQTKAKTSINELLRETL